MSIWQFFTGTSVPCSSSHYAFTPLPLHLDMPGFSTTTFFHWTCRTLFHYNGFLQVHKPRDRGSTPLFRRTGIPWRGIVVFYDGSWLLLHSVSFIVGYMYVPLRFHGKGHRIHRRHTVLTIPKFTDTSVLKYSLWKHNRTATATWTAVSHTTVLDSFRRARLLYDCWSLTWYLCRWWKAQPSWMSGELLHSVTKEFRETGEVIYPGISDTTAANNPLQNGSTTRAQQVILNKVI